MVFLDRHDSCLHEVHIPVGEKGEKHRTKYHRSSDNCSEGNKEGYGKIVKYWVVGSKEKSIVLKKEMCQFKLKVITLQ